MSLCIAGILGSTGPGTMPAAVHTFSLWCDSAQLFRLLERGRRYQLKLAEAQRQAEEAPRDPATGRLLFKPKTHRAPQWERNPEGGCAGRAASRSLVPRTEVQSMPTTCTPCPACPGGRLALTPRGVRGVRSAGAPIGEYLYAIKAEWDEKAARVREVQERRAQQNASSTFVNNRSEVRAVPYQVSCSWARKPDRSLRHSSTLPSNTLACS